MDLLAAILEREHLDRVIVFCNTKNTTDRITGLLRMRGIAAQCIHGDLGQKVREKVLSSFRAGQLRVLVATDVAARGLDIDDVDGVINYDIPEEGEYYVHRIGRTGPGQAPGRGLQPHLLRHRRRPPGRNHPQQPVRRENHYPLRRLFPIIYADTLSFP